MSPDHKTAKKLAGLEARIVDILEARRSGHRHTRPLMKAVGEMARPLLQERFEDATFMTHLNVYSTQRVSYDRLVTCSNISGPATISTNHLNEPAVVELTRHVSTPIRYDLEAFKAQAADQSPLWHAINAGLDEVIAILDREVEYSIRHDVTWKVFVHELPTLFVDFRGCDKLKEEEDMPRQIELFVFATAAILPMPGAPLPTHLYEDDEEEVPA